MMLSRFLRFSLALNHFWARLRKLGVLKQHSLNATFLPLYEIYEDTFEVVRATTQELKEAAHRLRYQVYCVEEPFESPADNPGGLEIDEYDQRSVHTLLIHRRSGMLVGNVRLVLPATRTPFSFPMQNLVSIDKWRDPHHVQISCEISRFCVSKDFRKREGDGLYTGVFLGRYANPVSLFTKAHRQRIIPFTALGLVRGIFEMAIENEIIWGYALLEPQLIRILRKLGIGSDLLGPAVSYHGERYPVRMDPLKICRSVEKKNPEVWKVLTRNGRIVEKMETLVSKHEKSAPSPRSRFRP
jgi:N-acyl amino acid synthase of PEP-CTERM/exosortase system